MGEQHLAQFVVYRFTALFFDEGQRDIAQRKAHQRLKLLVRVFADDGDQRGTGRENGMARLGRQPVPGAVAAGGGVAFAAGGQHRQRGAVFPAISSARAADSAVFQNQPGNGGLYHLHAAPAGKFAQGVGNIHGAVADRKDPAAALGFKRDTQPFKDRHGLLRREGVGRAHQKAGIAPHCGNKLLRGAVIGEVAAALAGHQDLAGGALPLFQHQYPLAALAGKAGGKHPGGPAADDDSVKLLHGAEWISSFFS